jgi:hypothetical protein
VPQQYPSAQLPDWHCALELHGVPFATLPQDPLTQGAPTQSPSPLQVLAHAVPPALHLNGAQVTLGASTQLPIPSHDEPLTAALPAALQLPLPQLVALGQSSHCPLPSHLPSSWQVLGSVAVQPVCPVPGACPCGTGEHWPARFGRLHC